MLSIVPLADQLSTPDIGEEIFSLASELYPICRSITGHGVRKTLAHLSDHVRLDIREVPTGTKAFDWAVPQEWNIRDAFIKNAAGERILDFQACNLHVVSYSAPVQGHFQLSELKRHIFTLPDQPDLIPYRTSYYKEEWGFCMSHRQLEALEAAGGEYEVVIASRLEPGTLTWGEYLRVGESTDEVLISTHICHP